MKLQKKTGIIALLFLLLAVPSVAQTGNGGGQDSGQLRGKVVDSAGIPVPGAGVIVKGTNRGASTDIDGNYTIAAAPGTTLVVSSLGYIPVEVKVGTSSVLNITLEEENQMLNELVVVGYGTQKKANLTGAVSVVKAEDA